MLDSFDIEGPNGRHRCLVHPPLWESILDFRHRNLDAKLPAPVIAFVLKRLFLALDFLHTECHVAHTDIKEANILFGTDESVLTALEQKELKTPGPRKELDGRTIYLSHGLDPPKDVGAPVLCDLGSAVRLDDGIEHREDIQPNVYRAPEVILDIPWTYSVDVWNVGCMVSDECLDITLEQKLISNVQIWDAFEGGHLFTGQDPEFKAYRGRAHLAEMIALLGPPPPSLLARANLKSKFFSTTGESMLSMEGEPCSDTVSTDVFSAGITVPESLPLEHREIRLEGDDKSSFLRLMRRMLQWEPEKRSSARELAEDEWILRHTR